MPAGDRVAALVARRDRAGLARLIEYDRVPCGVGKPGRTAPPPCRKGEAAATPVDAVVAQADHGCGRRYRRAERIGDLLGMFFHHRFVHYDRATPRLYAMYRSSVKDGWPAQGAVGLVFSWQWTGSEASTIGLNTEGRIVSIATRHCGYDPRLVLYQSQGSFVLGPRER